MKKIIAILIILVIVGAVIYSFTMNKEEPVVSGEKAVAGTVTAVNTDQVAADGPAVVTIKADSGAEIVVIVRSMGINFCPAQSNIADVYQLKVGDKVEARGDIADEGRILPCESASHYLRVVSQ